MTKDMCRVFWKSGLLALILLPASLLFSLSYQGRTKKVTGKCQGRVRLSSVASAGEDLSLFFLETSGKPVLDARQACSVESALDRAGEAVTVVMNSYFLDLADNSTCQLYLKSKASGSLKFLKMDLEHDFRGTLF